MTITAKMVQELRSRSGAGLMECKKALAATEGNIEAAFDHLRKAGLKTAEKKAGRSMGEGLVTTRIGDGARSGSIVALTCETDFVARTDDFQAMVANIAAHVLEHAPKSAEELLGQTLAATGETIELSLKGMTGKLGENMAVGDFARAEGSRVGAYVHHDNKKGVLIALEGEVQGDADAFLKNLGMHVVAMRPTYLTRDEVPADVLDREKDIYRAEVEGKPAEIQEKILNGKLQKYFAEVCLVDQPWVLDDSKSVGKALAAELGAGAKIASFHRFQVGG
jgi:elongation factor Ts